jgi:hypothetical protein
MYVFKLIRTTALWILLIPAGLIFAGAASNQAVLIANHDTFPVLLNKGKTLQAAEAEAKSNPDVVADGEIDNIHCIMTNKTHLNYLADIFDLQDGVYSIGDLSMEFGEFLWVYAPYLWAFVTIQKLSKQ